MNLTLELLKFTDGIEDSSTAYLDDEEMDRLYRHSVKNRFATLFLYKYHLNGTSNKLTPYWEREHQRYLNTMRAIGGVSNLFSDGKIPHAFFKTVRPYISATVDIDIIVMGNHGDYSRAITMMQDNGYEMHARGPESATFRDPEMDIGIDIYDQIAVSYTPYIDKVKLRDKVTFLELPDGNKICNLTPEADLLAIIAHSIVKENMYTLSEYYTYINYLVRLNVDEFLGLVDETHLRHATATHSTITAILYRGTHGAVPVKIQRILDELGASSIEAHRVVKGNFRMPFKYHPVTVLRSLMEIAREKTFRRGIASQILRSMNPEFLSEGFLKKLLSHATRETY